MPGFRPIHLIRYGVPVAILLAGVLLMVVGAGAIANAAGIVLVGVAFMVYLVNVLARLAIASQRDRELEQEARERFARSRRPEQPASSVERQPRRRLAGRAERPLGARQRSEH